MTTPPEDLTTAASGTSVRGDSRLWPPTVPAGSSSSSFSRSQSDAQPCAPKTDDASRVSTCFVVGDVLDVLARLPDASVDLVMSSPPFLGLRSYLPDDHPDKAKEIGTESSPADLLDALLDVAEECRRVLTPTGSLVFELGDTYSQKGGKGKRTKASARHDGTLPPAGVTGGSEWPLPKSLCGIPDAFLLSLSYGQNVLRSERKTPRWVVRNKIVWARPNPAPGELRDKFRPATTYLTVAATASDRWFDGDALRALCKDTGKQSANGPEPLAAANKTDRLGAPLFDWWKIPVQPYKGPHYATFPVELPRRVIVSMCPGRVCTECGEPSRRITKTTCAPGYDVQRAAHRKSPERARNGRRGRRRIPSITSERVTTGWTDCGHDSWRPGVVLDPFVGSGTTLAVARELGRSSIGIDIDERNVLLARERVGDSLEVHELAAAEEEPRRATSWPLATNSGTWGWRSAGSSSTNARGRSDDARGGGRRDVRPGEFTTPVRSVADCPTRTLRQRGT
jgi:DNA modification methylase